MPVRYRGKISLTVNEACEASGIKRTTFYKLRKEGVIWTFKWGGRTLIYDEVLRAAIAHAASGGAPAERADVGGPFRG